MRFGVAASVSLRGAPARRRLAAAGFAALLLAAAVAGCAGGPQPTTPRGHGSARVLVVLPPAPPGVWERHAGELALEHRLYYYRAWKMETLDEVCIVYGLYPGEPLERTVSRLANDPRVRSAQLVQTFEVLSAPPARDAGGGGDPYAHLQQGGAAMRFDRAHRWATGRGVTVAVVDTGVDVGHPDLAGRVVRADNFVDRGERSFTRDVHGTAVAGVVAAVAGNGVGIAGVAPDAGIHALKACWPVGGDGGRAECDSYTLAQAVDLAVTAGARVLNLSLTGPRDALLARLIARAVERGVAVVAAVDDARHDLGFPASLPGVIPVRAAPRDAAAVAAPEAGAAGGRGGDDRVLLAPGVDVLSTVPGGGYDFFSGSSLAAAHVSGLAALLLERQPRLAPAELARRMAAARVGATAAVDACRAVADLVGAAGGCSDPADRLAR
jgi:hypothetical protein